MDFLAPKTLSIIDTKNQHSMGHGSKIVANNVFWWSSWILEVLSEGNHYTSWILELCGLEYSKTHRNDCYQIIFKKNSYYRT